MRMHVPAAVLALLVLAVVPAAAESKPKPVDCVTLATTWEAAVAEAKLLNLPIVVHNHGFFCPPCWGMHSGVMQHKGYMEFAEKHTVEVIALGSLADGIAKNDKRAEEYEVKEDGKVVKYMVEFPGLTRDQVLALGSSHAASYNKTGGVPYTCVVDPYTLEELKHWEGGAHSAKSLMEEIEPFHDALVKEHGKGLARKDLRKYEDAESKALASSGEGEYAKALDTLRKATKKVAEWPEALQLRAKESEAGVLRDAAKALDEIQALGATDAKEAKKSLGRLRSRLRGTGLEERAKQLLAELSAPSTAQD